MTMPTETPIDIPHVLREAESLAQQGRYSDALARWESAARGLDESRQALKCVSVSRQILSTVEKSAPNSMPDYAHVFQRLGRLYTELGLDEEANAVMRRYGKLATKR